ncbi:hypothetical protein Dimus_037863 [Dionaea muscipula]
MAGLDSIVLLDEEVQEVAPPTGTPEEVGAEKTESGPVASPPTKKRTLKKKADEKEAESTEVATGKELILAPQQPVAKKDLGRVTRSKKCEVEKKKMLPSLDLPTNLLPTDHPAHTTDAPPPRSILSTDSMLLNTNGDKEERHQMRVQWARESITEKDKDLAEHMTDVQLRQWTTHAAAQVMITSPCKFPCFVYGVNILTLFVLAATYPVGGVPEAARIGRPTDAKIFD